MSSSISPSSASASATSSQDNYDKSRTMMDNIGEHCTVCNQLDFLPFTCHACHKSFCSDHRELYNEHECLKKLKSSQDSTTTATTTATAKSLFPDRSEQRLGTALAAAQKPNSILSQMHSKANSSSSGSDEENFAKLALLKLKKFLSKKKSTSANGSGSGMSLFKKKPTTTSTASAKIIELSKLKSKAVGDPKIPSTERIYIKVQYVPSADELSKSNNKKTDFMAIYVSRTWPIGRLLDQAANHLKIKNMNNRTQDPESKLTIFREPRSQSEDNTDEPIYIPANSRVIKEIKDADVLYVVRGAAII